MNWRAGLTENAWDNVYRTGELHVTESERHRLDTMFADEDIWTPNKATCSVPVQAQRIRRYFPVLSDREFYESLKYKQPPFFRPGTSRNPGNYPDCRLEPSEATSSDTSPINSMALEEDIRTPQSPEVGYSPARDSPRSEHFTPFQTHSIPAVEDIPSGDSALQALAATAVYVKGLKRFVIRNERNIVQATGKDPLSTAQNYMESVLSTSS